MSVEGRFSRSYECVRLKTEPCIYDDKDIIDGKALYILVHVKINAPLENL